MDTRTELATRGDLLEEVTRRLYAQASALDEDPNGPPCRELARAVGYWSIVVRRLSRTGPDAFAMRDFHIFRGPPGESPPPRPPEGPAEETAELDLMTAYLIGDQVLEAFAYTEMVRRQAEPQWTKGGRVPDMWPKFMALMDAAPGDPMSPTSRYLDATLAPARDVLIVHRDPHTYHMPIFSSWGAVELERPAMDPERRAAAEEMLRKLDRDREWSWGYEDADMLLRALLGVPKLLDATSRKAILDVYRMGGYRSGQPLTALVDACLKLLRRYSESLPLPVAD